MSICRTYALPPKASDHHDSVARKVHLPFFISKHIRVLEVLWRVSLLLLEEDVWVAEQGAGGRELLWRQNQTQTTSASPPAPSLPQETQLHVASFKALLNRHNLKLFDEV